MADTKLSDLDNGTLPPDYYYGIEGGAGKKYHGPRTVNVKDFGATGDGSTDDTAFIQNAFDAAFGSYASPNAASSALNRPVYFPAGNYKVVSQGSATVTGAASASGKIRLTLSSPITGVFNDFDPVLVSDVGGVPNANSLWAIKVIDSTHVDLLGTTFAGSYTSGGVMKLPCLKGRALQGVKIFGDERFTSRIFTTDTKCAVISTNGCSFSKFEDLTIDGGSGGVAFDLGWMLDQGSETTNCQSNKFECVHFSGGKFGLAIGGAQNMGSETTILNCYFILCDVGLATLNGNAVMQTVTGGNFAQNGTAIKVISGGIESITGVSFQQSSVADINIDYSADDVCTISGCRSENSAVFLITGPGGITPGALGVTVNSCAFLGTSGMFHNGHAPLTVNSCVAPDGYFNDGGSLTINSSVFPTDFLTRGIPAFSSVNVTPQIVTTQTGATYTFTGADSSSKVLFNRASAQTVTLPRTHGNGTFLQEGAKIEVVQTGAGQVTFQAGSSVTVRSAHGLKLAAQWSVATLTIVAPDVWLLSGDTTT